MDMKKPKWLRRDLTGNKQAVNTGFLIKEHGLHTVCESARCPNKGECYSYGTATFLALGNICTRNCTFCAVDKDLSSIKPPDKEEPDKIAHAAAKLNLEYLVVTMVTRDDLADGGAGIIADIITKARVQCPSNLLIEVLVSDFQGDFQQVKKVLEAQPDVFNHNLETVPRLYSLVRPQADYQRSLGVLDGVKKHSRDMLTKSGFMVGLGETAGEVYKMMDDLRDAGVEILTIGQYLAPSIKHFPVKEYIHPDIFSRYRETALAKGFLDCLSGPFVRSSYRADYAKELIKKL